MAKNFGLEAYKEIERLRAENERLHEALFNAHMAMLTWHRLNSEQRGKAILAVATAGKQ